MANSMKEMTIDEFIAEVRSLGLTWRLEGYGTLRCEIGDCPIIAVANARLVRYGRRDRWNNATAGSAGQMELGLSPLLTFQIIKAADGHSVGGLRQRLITELIPEGERDGTV